MKDDITIIIVAGGDATRLPGKLALDAGGLPLLVRVYQNVAQHRPALIAARELAPELAARLPVGRIGEDGPKRGPLGGIMAALAHVQTDWFFAVAGDAPFVDAAHVERLSARRNDTCDAIVPRHPTGQVEPLAALYRRSAYMREGERVLGETAALRDVVAHLRTIYVDVEDARIFTNVNTPADYDALRAAIGPASERS
jgi:molybdopterin-guanine dinucleotide biosynthesis protein A